MNKTSLIALAVFTAAFAGTAAAQDSAYPLLGTWELVQTRAENANDYTDVPKKRRELVLYTPTYFAVVNYDTTTKKSGAALGGRYTLSGGDYREIIEFPAIKGKAATGNTNLFTVRFEGDRFTKTGTLSNGRKVSEIWQKVR
jgi:hypothetical protein